MFLRAVVQDVSEIIELECLGPAVLYVLEQLCRMLARLLN